MTRRQLERLAPRPALDDEARRRLLKQLAACPCLDCRHVLAMVCQSHAAS